MDEANINKYGSHRSSKMQDGMEDEAMQVHIYSYDTGRVYIVGPDGLPFGGNGGDQNQGFGLYNL